MNDRWFAASKTLYYWPLLFQKTHIVKISIYVPLSHTVSVIISGNTRFKFPSVLTFRKKKGWQKQFGHLGRTKCIHLNFPKFKFQEVRASLQAFRMFDWFLCPCSLQCFPSLLSPLVSDDGVVRGVNHCGVVDCGEISVHQVKVVQAQ